jgi:hypothetical protein
MRNNCGRVGGFATAGVGFIPPIPAAPAVDCLLAAPGGTLVTVNDRFFKFESSGGKAGLRPGNPIA